MRKLLLCAVMAMSLLVADNVLANGGVVFQGFGGANVVQVNTRRGLFGGVRSQQIVSSNGFNTNVTNIRNRGLFGRRQVVNSVNVNNGFGGANVAVFNNRGFRRNNFVSVATPFANVNVNGFRVNRFNTARVNVFGTRTFVNGAGQIFEVDAFGNTAFRGNAFHRGFGGNAFVSSASVFRGFSQPSFVSVNSGCFGGQCFTPSFNSFSVRSFGGCR